jgi:hypothetical protein
LLRTRPALPLQIAATERQGCPHKDVHWCTWQADGSAVLQTLVLRTSVSAGRQVVRLGQLLQLRLVSDVRVLQHFSLVCGF